MTQEQLFAAALMIQKPWEIEKIEFNPDKGRLDIDIGFSRGSLFHYESTSEGIAGDFKAYDVVEKTWRHLNFFQYQCFLHAKVPRVDTGSGIIRQVKTPWEGVVPGFTLLMEAFVLQLARSMPIRQIAKLIGATDNRLWRLLRRYVEKALEQQNLSKLSQIGIDETAVLRGHKYITLFVDLKERKTVFVTEGKGSETLQSFSAELVARGGHAENIQVVSQDMSPAFEAGVRRDFPKADIVYDRFHLMKMVNEALDLVRSQESKSEPDLKRTRYVWLKNSKNLTATEAQKLSALRMKDKELKTARAWRMKSRFQELYLSGSTEEFGAKLKEWVGWVMRSRLVAMKEVAKTILRHWNGIINWVAWRVSNGILEGLNSAFQAAKAKARGYKRLDTIKTVIFLLTGRLNFSGLNPYLPI
jgi:transposase